VSPPPPLPPECIRYVFPPTNRPRISFILRAPEPAPAGGCYYSPQPIHGSEVLSLLPPRYKIRSQVQLSNAFPDTGRLFPPGPYGETLGPTAINCVKAGRSGSQNFSLCFTPLLSSFFLVAFLTFSGRELFSGVIRGTLGSNKPLCELTSLTRSPLPSNPPLFPSVVVFLSPSFIALLAFQILEPSLSGLIMAASKIM